VTGRGRRGVALASILCALSPMACDPCSGVARCNTNGAYLAAAGRLVDRVSGDGIDGARIDVVRRAGVAVEQDSLSATTSDGGYWRVEFAPSAAGEVVVDAHVRPPGEPGYRIRGLTLTTRLHGGDANLNQSWVSTPYFNYAGELFLRGTVDDRIQNRPIQFRIRSGVATAGSGVRDSVFRASTDVGGRVELLPKSLDGGLLPLGGEDLVGDLTADLASPPGPAVVRSVSLSPSYVQFEVVRILRMPIGP
jgi:hypothetical protein